MGTLYHRRSATQNRDALPDVGRSYHALCTPRSGADHEDWNAVISARLVVSTVTASLPRHVINRR